MSPSVPIRVAELLENVAHLDSIRQLLYRLQLSSRVPREMCMNLYRMLTWADQPVVMFGPFFMSTNAPGFARDIDASIVL